MRRRAFLPVVVAGLSLAFPTSAQAQTNLPEFVFPALIGAGIMLVAFTLFLFWVLMLVDLMKRDESQFPNPTGKKKTIWLTAFVVSLFLNLHWLTATLYYFMVKRAQTATNSTA